MEHATESKNFIEQIIDKDLAEDGSVPKSRLLFIRKGLGGIRCK